MYFYSVSGLLQGLIQLVTVPLTVFVTIKFTVWQGQLRREADKKSREAFAIKNDIVQNYSTVKVLPIECVLR
jgi:ABC-type transport system involved in Fe-S cluster assembly fused permease/ATPase subunit